MSDRTPETDALGLLGTLGHLARHEKLMIFALQSTTWHSAQLRKDFIKSSSISRTLLKRVSNLEFLSLPRQFKLLPFVMQNLEVSQIARQSEDIGSDYFQTSSSLLWSKCWNSSQLASWYQAENRRSSLSPSHMKNSSNYICVYEM